MRTLTKAFGVFALAGLAALLAAPSGRADDDWARRQEEERRQRRIWSEFVDSIGPDHPLAGRDYFAVITYSPATGKFGGSHGWINLGSARRMARISCGASDARPLVWVKNGYCAVAAGKDGAYAVGYAPTLEKAKDMALGECRKRTAECRIAAWVFSGRREGGHGVVGGDGSDPNLGRTTRR